MNTVNNSELPRIIKGYLAERNPMCPLVIAGKPDTGRSSIFFKTLSSLGLGKVPFYAVMQMVCGGENLVAYARCDDPSRYNLDYHLALDFVGRTHRHVILITDADNIEDLDDFRMKVVNYTLTFNDWWSWGTENIGTCGREHPRMNMMLLIFLDLHPEWFEGENALSPRQWKKVSDRWNYLERNNWMADNLGSDEKLPLYIAALQDYSPDDKLLIDVHEYLNGALCCSLQ